MGEVPSGSSLLRVKSCAEIHPKKTYQKADFSYIWKIQVGIFTFIYGCFLIGKLGSWAVVKGPWVGWVAYGIVLVCFMEIFLYHQQFQVFLKWRVSRTS